MPSKTSSPYYKLLIKLKTRKLPPIKIELSTFEDGSRTVWVGMAEYGHLTISKKGSSKDSVRDIVAWCFLVILNPDSYSSHYISLAVTSFRVKGEMGTLEIIQRALPSHSGHNKVRKKLDRKQRMESDNRHRQQRRKGDRIRNNIKKNRGFMEKGGDGSLEGESEEEYGENVGNVKRECEEKVKYVGDKYIGDRKNIKEFIRDEKNGEIEKAVEEYRGGKNVNCERDFMSLSGCKNDLLSWIVFSDLEMDRDRNQGKKPQSEKVGGKERNRKVQVFKSQMDTKKVQKRRWEEAMTSNSSHYVTPATVERSVIDNVETLHWEVAETVMSVLNTYYPEAKEFMGEVKIVNYAEYREMAKSFSHRLRSEIKESYEAFNNGSLDGITFTIDNQHYVKTVIEVELDKMPILRR